MFRWTPWHTRLVNRPIQPNELAPPVASYALAVLSERPDRVLHTSGIVPVNPDGSVSEHLVDQASTVWSAIGTILAEVDMSVEDIVSVVTYVVVGEDLGTVMAARDSFFGEHRAASTLVTVPALARPEWKLEASIVAAASAG